MRFRHRPTFGLAVLQLLAAGLVAGCTAQIAPSDEAAEADDEIPAPDPRDAVRPPAGPPDASSPDTSPDAALADRAPADGASADGSLEGPPSPVGAVAPIVLPAVVPVLWIEVGGKTIKPEVKIPGRMRVIEDHDGTLNGIASRPATLTVPIGIEIRGQSSATFFPKKGYSLELRNDAGLDVDLPLLGMPSESDWAMHACYSDKTCMRNALTYALGAELGRYAPRARYAELFIDGKYAGLYVVIEKIKRGKNRVVMPRVALAPPGDMTGGYIFRREGEGKGKARDWVSAGGIRWTYHEPRAEEINLEQKAYLHDHVNKFEAMMKSSAYADPVTGYPAMIDVPSWIDYSLMHEFVNNVDCYWKSTYIVKQPQAAGGRLVMGPLWDFDLAYGNVNFSDASRTDTWRNPIIPFQSRLWKDPPYQNGLKCRWLELRAQALSLPNIFAKIDAYALHIAAAEQRDHALWKVIGVSVWPNQYVGKTYADEVKYLRDWITKRVAFMDAKLPGVCPPR